MKKAETIEKIMKNFFTDLSIASASLAGSITHF